MKIKNTLAIPPIQVMKRILYFALIMLQLQSCNTKKQHPEYAKLSGKILNANSKEISIYGMNGYKKSVKLDMQGIFTDTLKLNTKFDQFHLLLEKDTISTPIYIKNGENISLTADATNFKETAQFENDNADYNNFIIEKQRMLSSNKSYKKDWYRLDKSDFKYKTETLKAEFMKALKAYSNIPEDKISTETSYIESLIKRITDKYDEEHNLFKKLKQGTVSPTFEKYENYDGSKTSLSDFTGKYVYIDVWATWCGPCKYQIPFLETLEKNYRDKNITFISISVDDQKDKNKWRKMIEDKHMSGTQIIAPDKFESNFIKAYGVNAIPRFILIDPKGKVVDYNAPRPSNKEKIQALLSSLDL